MEGGGERERERDDTANMNSPHVMVSFFPLSLGPKGYTSQINTQIQVCAG